MSSDFTISVELHVSLELLLRNLLASPLSKPLEAWRYDLVNPSPSVNGVRSVLHTLLMIWGQIVSKDAIDLPLISLLVVIPWLRWHTEPLIRARKTWFTVSGYYLSWQASSNIVG